MTRFASFNVENLFARPKAFNQTTWEAGEPVLAAFSECNALMSQPAYSAAEKARMIELLLQLEVYRRREGAAHRNRAAEASIGRGRADVGPGQLSTAAEKCARIGRRKVHHSPSGLW